MNKIKLILFALALLLIPNTIVNADQGKAYKDNVYDIVNESNIEDKVVVYLFHQASCPHCQKENLFLDQLEKDYKDKIVVRRYEISMNDTNSNYYNEVIKKLNISTNYVPLTVIGEKHYLGYSSTTGESIKDTVIEYIEELDNKDNPNKENNEEKIEYIKLPLLGKIDAKKVSIPIVAIILGTIDGFNPCAMWVLLFLINMLFNMKDRKKMWILGITFLFTSAFVYFLAMLGLSFVLGFTAVIWVRRIIAMVAIIGGIVNLRSYIKTPKDGCTVVDEKKRKKYFTKIKKFTNEQNMILALIGVITLALSVNLVELACSAGFPTIFATILDLNGISFISSIMYILIYIIFYLLDDIIIFVIAMLTLQISGLTTKYNRLTHLVGGIIMIIIGLLLIFKPDWIMLNF